MIVMAETPGRTGYEAQMRALFPNLVKYEGWQGSGHFLDGDGEPGPLQPVAGRISCGGEVVPAVGP